MMDWNRAMELNRMWWSGLVDGYHFMNYGYYTVDMILEENRYMTRIKELNSYVITTNGQDETSDLESSKSDIRFLEQYKREYLSNVLCKSYQRPYLDFFCTRKQLEKIKKINHEKIGIR